MGVSRTATAAVTRRTATGSTSARFVDDTVLNIAGTGYQGAGGLYDGFAATQAHVNSANSIAFGPDGQIYFVEGGAFVRRISSRVRGFGDLTDHFIASPDGSEVWRFDGVGRHLQTLHGLTGAVLWSFGYDLDGFLVTITDGSGNITTITRNIGGHATGIVGPYGQATVLLMDGDGRLESVTNSNGETVTLGYSAAGLLGSLATPRGYTHSYLYNVSGELESDEDPAGGSKAIGKTALGETTSRNSGRQLTISTFLGRLTTALVEFMKAGERKQTVTGPDGTATGMTYDNGTSKTTAATRSEHRERDA